MQNKPEITFIDFLEGFKNYVRIVFRKKYQIGIIGLIGGALGILYTFSQPITYTAKITFVVEDGKNSSTGLSGLATLAGQFGVDLGGNNSGVLAGDNILLYFKSQSLIKEVLLESYDTSGNVSIADEYIKVYRLNKKWSKDNIGEKFKIYKRKAIDRNARVQDSILINVISDIQKSGFTISKTDKKGTFIDVVSSMQSERLAKIFCEKIVDIAIRRYLSIKTERQRNTVDKLQMRADSIRTLLGAKTQATANLQTSLSTMDLNPLFKTNSTITTETTMRDKTILATMYASVIQNLEIAKFTLSQETPVIQIIDTPIEPLKINKPSKILAGSASAFVTSILFIIWIFYRELNRKK